jgi:membrane-bound ClpP family serine protease
MSGALIWPIACLAAGLILLIAEVFVPSGGMIGFLALGLLGVSLWQAFAVSATTGTMFLVALAVLLPITLAIAVKLWPRTPFGRRMILRPPSPGEVDPEPLGAPLEHLLGQYGRTLTPLRPAGMVDFDGRRLDALSEEGLLPAGALVQAVRLRGREIVVRAADPRALDEIGSFRDA